MIAEIAQNRKNEFISIRHLGLICNGVEDTTSESVLAWAPAHENYTFISLPEGTNLVIELEVFSEWEQYMTEAWPMPHFDDQLRIVEILKRQAPLKAKHTTIREANAALLPATLEWVFAGSQ